MKMMHLLAVVQGPDEKGMFTVIKLECNNNPIYPMCCILGYGKKFNTKEEAERRAKKDMCNLKRLRRKKKKGGEKR
jgi:hypothetical protein